MDADWEVIGDLVARERRSDDPLLRTDGDPPRDYTYRKFCTNAWKAGNLFRHHGVREGRSVAVAGLAPEALLSVLGAFSLGAVVTVDPPRECDPALLVAPAATMPEYTVPPGTKRVAYGGPAEDPEVAHFERDSWSENPTEPPAFVEGTDPALAADGATYTHETLLDAAARVAAEWGLEPGDEVTVRAPLADPGTLVGGVLAPLVAGAGILLPMGGEAVAEFAVTEESAPEDRTVAPGDVRL